ncbi:MAG: DNA polymerase III subunit gamma/tau [Candidatus Omnitrophota bacterium]|nr:DNA polymerase III subunit gamma/tau [Candidatus Omnitrophota bacterium]
MGYIVFARKYRPQFFEEIVGQSHITTTLTNAISQDRVAHAYLFAGPRGVGKTTAARILAKALNCEKGSTPKPCNACASCKEITQGSSLDILEIDGASNRGIDEIRTLRENVKFSPAKGRFKVYIIDEVHMLTAEAFNALLKTLEEPPPHVKFIFATTQANKVPATILSRCQRFDFRRIAAKDIAENLKKIAKVEKIDIDDEALGLIARYSDGGMRNGQVILDQIASSAKGAIGSGDVARILGIVDDDLLFGLSGAIKEKNAVSALKTVDSLVNEGKDVSQAVLGLIEHFRNISIAKICQNPGSLMDAGSEKIKRYTEEAKKFTIEEILYIIYTFSSTIDFIRKSSLSRIPLEAALIKLTQSGSIISLDEILKRLDMIGAVKDLPPKKIETVINPVRNNRETNISNGVNDQPVSSDVEEILSSWKAVIDYIKNKKISIASYLQEGYPLSLEDNTLSIAFPKDLKFHKEVLETPDNKRLIEEGLKAVLKSNLRVSLVLVEPLDIKRRDTGKYLEQPADDCVPEEASVEESKDVDPIVKAALEMFGGSIAAKAEGKGKAS